MRILYFSDNVSVHNRRFLEKLISYGHDVHFLSITCEELPEGWLPRGVHAVEARKKLRHGASPGEIEQFLPEFRALLHHLQPDLVHAGPVQSCAYIAALAGFHPLMVASWGSDVLLHAERNADWKRAVEVALLGADGFLCDCETVRRAAQRIAPISGTRIAQFPWGIKAGSFSSCGAAYSKEGLGFAADSFVFLCARAWEPLYEIDVLLEAFRRAHCADARLRLILLGGGSEASRIRRFISNLGLTSQVLIPGIIASRELPQWFRSADAYVSCARSDGTSISLLEAMATGLPVIVADNASNREWVAENENGWLAEIGSPQAFEAKLLRVARLTVFERRTISERNQRIVAERADWDRNFPMLLRLYDCLVRDPVMVQA